MISDGDRIIANLPPTFGALPRPTALAALADAFGGELRDAENSLAAMMFAHWVDTADTNTPNLVDLPAIAALYGLAPRDDETIEGFRAHLKRHVLTILEGTMTVRGALRVAAEALGLIIADGDGELDTWWDRDPARPLVIVTNAGDDAATRLFGVGSALVRGTAAQSAVFAGSADLSQPIDLRGHLTLRLAVDGGAVTATDLALPHPEAADRAAIIAAINTVPGVVAAPHGLGLLLRSQSAGAGSRLDLGDGDGDAVPLLLGIAPHEYRGDAPLQARIIGTVDLPSTLDLGTQRYLRLAIDGAVSFEVDCAGANAASTTPNEIVAAVNAEAGAPIAAIAGNRLVLSSPTAGLAGSIGVRAATSDDAAPLLLGDAAATYARGADAGPARVTGSADLSAGVDLSQRSKLLLAVDTIAPIVVDCVGADPQNTLAAEIAASINAAFGLPLATQNGSTVTLTSHLIGATARIAFLTAPAGDALDLIFGLTSRSARGADAAPARVTGNVDLSGGVDLRALKRLQLAIDDADPVVVTLPSRAAVAPADIVSAINAAGLGPIASTDGTHLQLTADAPGEQGSVALIPIETIDAPPFVTRGFPIDEASSTVLGLISARLTGGGPAAAVLTGRVDLVDGLDLRVTRFLRLAIDGSPPRDIDCAARSQRPRAVLLHDLAAAIDAPLGSAVASVDTGRLVLTSPSSGAASVITLLPDGGDAAALIFGPGLPAAAGRTARAVTFTGMRDLSGHVDLGAANLVRLAIDGATPVEIACSGANPAQTSAAEIVGSINAALGSTRASTDGTFVRLTSPTAGSAGSIAFLTPSQHDATRLIFGISPERTYRGEDAVPATLSSAQDLPATLDLSATPFLRLAADTGTPPLIDCRGADPAHTTAAEIAAAIGRSLPAVTATVSAGKVTVTTLSSGAGSRLAVLAAGDGDAGAALIGAATTVRGADAGPAALTGTVDLRAPVDLSQRPMLRIAVDDGRPVDIDVAGAAPDQSFGTEVAAAVNAVLPGVATVDTSGRLVLTSPSVGPGSAIEVVPLRPIELIEYPAEKVSLPAASVAAGGRVSVMNDGAAPAAASLSLANRGGFCGGDVIAWETGWRIHIEAGIRGTESLAIRAAADGSIAALRIDAAGTETTLPPGSLTASPGVLAALVPYYGTRPLARGIPGARLALALIDPLAPNILVLEALAGAVPPPAVGVTAATVGASSPPPSAPAGRIELLGQLEAAGRSGTLLGSAGTVIATIRAGVALAAFNGAMVSVQGRWYPSESAPLLAVDTIARLFDVTIGAVAYDAVALDSRTGARSLAARLAAGGGPPVIARPVAPAEALGLPRGRSEWLLLACAGARYNTSRYEEGRFAPGPCDVPGVFNATRFAARSDLAAPQTAVTDERPRFAPLAEAPPTSLGVSWEARRPGAFAVHLPVDLPDIFGARFNAARFTSPRTTSEAYPGVVLEPATDPEYLPTILPLTGGSPLVYALPKPFVPLGWEAQTVPFAQPRTRYLSGGSTSARSALYLREPGVPGVIGIFARTPGSWGDQIGITVRYAGPAMFDLTITYAGARFECARSIVLAGRVLAAQEDPLPALIADIIKPRPIGVVQAKAAGIAVAVTRDRT